MEEFARNLADLIRETRLTFCMTQEELAKKAGVHRSTISRLEDPLRSSTVRYKTMCSVVRTLRIDPNRIFYYEKYGKITSKQILSDCLQTSPNITFPSQNKGPFTIAPLSRTGGLHNNIFTCICRHTSVNVIKASINANLNVSHFL